MCFAWPNSNITIKWTNNWRVLDNHIWKLFRTKQEWNGSETQGDFAVHNQTITFFFYLQVAVRIGASQCSDIGWVSSTVITCRVSVRFRVAGYQQRRLKWLVCMQAGFGISEVAVAVGNASECEQVTAFAPSGLHLYRRNLIWWVSCYLRLTLSLCSAGWQWLASYAVSCFPTICPSSIG